MIRRQRSSTLFPYTTLFRSLPRPQAGRHLPGLVALRARPVLPGAAQEDRKSTRLNSSHLGISYAVFCLKKKRLAIDSTVDIFTVYHCQRHVSSEQCITFIQD